MSTYAIASAIDRLAEKYEKVMKEKNKIEREKLEFEREKFKQLSQQPEQPEHQQAECEHNWVYTDSTFDPSFMEYHTVYTCSKCGKTKTEVKSSISRT